MGLPKAIQEQAEAADALVAELNGQGPAPADTPPQVAAEPQPVVAAPVSEPQPAPVHEEDWKSKFHTLQGKYNAEVPRFAQQLRELTATVQTLMQENETLRAKAAAPTAPELDKPLVTDNDREVFGQDMIDLQERIARQTVAPLLKKIEQLESVNQELRSQVGTVGEKVAETSQHTFFTSLTNQVPEWESMNEDQGFLAWLDEVDPVYGVPRRSALDTAVNSLDAGRAAAVFKAYTSTRQPAKQSVQAKELQSQVAPTRSRQSPVAATNPNEGRIWTEREIQEFYNDWCRGHLDETEAVRIENDIQAAYVQGRIRK